MYTITLRNFFIILFFIIYTSTANAATITWVGGYNDNEWNQFVNWSPMIVPGINDDVIIPASFDGEIKIIGANASCKSINYTGTGFDLKIEIGWDLLIAGNLDISGSNHIHGLGGIEIVGNNRSDLNFSDSTVFSISHFNIKSDSTVYLNNDLYMPYGKINIFSGQFITNGKDVNINSISVISGTSDRILNIENSTITLNILNLEIRNNGQLMAANSTVNNNLRITTNDDVSFNVINSKHNTLIGTLYDNTSFLINELNSLGDISILGTVSQTNQAFSITHFNILHSPAIVKLTPEPYVSGYYFFKIDAPVTCNEILFTDGHEVSYNQVKVNIIGGTSLLKASLANINVATGTIYVQEGNDIGNNNGVIFNDTISKNYFWVNGEGNWEDSNHWSLSSGGPVAGCIPGLKDNVLFDNASGFLSGDTVFVNTHIFCKDIIASPGILHKPVIAQSVNSKYTFNISGDIDLSGFSSYNLYYPIHMWNKSLSNIRTNSHTILEDIYLLNTGTTKLLDTLNCLDGKKSIYHKLGGLVTNNHTVYAAGLVSKGSKVAGSERSLFLSNSDVHVGDASVSVGGVVIYSNNLILDAGTSDFIFEYQYNSNGEFKIEGAKHLDFYNLTFLNQVGTSQLIFNSKSSFNKIRFDGNGTIWNGSTTVGLELSGTDTLVITGKHRYEFEKGRIFNITDKVIHQHTICNELSIVTSTSLATPAYIYSAGTSVIDFTNTWLENISAIGTNTPFNIINGVNGGSNAGLNFLSLNVPRIFYWNGENNTSHWSVGRNWNINVPPIAGNNNDLPFICNPDGCVPGFNDSVVFHINSFPILDTVYVDETAGFSGMNWMPGVGINHYFIGNSQYSLHNYGGLHFDTGLNCYFSGDFFFRSPSAREVKFNNTSYPGSMIFYQLGTTILLDPLTCDGFSIRFMAGSFFSNSNHIKANNIFVQHSYAPQNNNNVLCFGNSTIDLIGVFVNHLLDQVSVLMTENSTINLNGSGSAFHIEGNLPGINFGYVNYKSVWGNVMLSSRYHSATTIPHFKHVNFECSSVILGDNSIDTLMLAEGRDYFMEATKTQFINDLLYSKGSPCYRTSIQSTIPGTRAYIKNLNCNLLVEHARLRDIEGIIGSCAINNYLVGVGGEDLGNNLNWYFIPGNPVEGLGLDTVLTCNSLPYIQTTLGFGRYDSITWNNGSSAIQGIITTDTTLSVRVVYSPTCMIDDERNFEFESHLNQMASINHVSCNGMNNGSIHLYIEDVDTNFIQKWIYPDLSVKYNDTVPGMLSPGLYTSIVTVPGFESVCNDTSFFTLLEPEKLMVLLDTFIAGKCTEPEGIVMISSSGGTGDHTYLWSNEQTSQNNYYAYSGINEVVVTDTNECIAKLSVNIPCIEHINIPELITPNGDGYGDEWEIIDLLRLYPDNEVKIMNRWGNIVYSKKSYNNEFTGYPNTGNTLSGGKLPSGTYFYIINLGSEYKTLRGYVEIIF